MTLEQVSELQPGDEVYWNDPDSGKCSRVIEIVSIEIEGDVVTAGDSDGALSSVSSAS